MRSNKTFTNATFTKRVDHDGGRHRTRRAVSEPATCKKCGAVYENRRWTAGQNTVRNKKHQHHRTVQMTICPACKQAGEGEPRGFVYLHGAFLVGHRKEIENLILNEAKRAGEDNPLARILELKEDDGHKLSVTTTTEHLARVQLLA